MRKPNCENTKLLKKIDCENSTLQKYRKVTAPVLTSDEGKKNSIGTIANILAMIRGILWIYTLHSSPEVLFLVFKGTFIFLMA